MNQFTPDLSLQQTLVRRSSIQLTCILIISLLSFAGWMFSISWLKHPFSGLVAMNPLSSICFVLLVVALQFKMQKESSRKKQTIADYISLFVLAIAFSKLVSIVFNIDYSLDQLLFAEQVTADVVGGFTNSMAPNTAFCFGLLSISLLFFGKLKRFFLVVSQVANVLALMIAVFSILGYIFGAEEFYEVQDFVPMAISSGICFLLLALAILFALPGVGIMQQLTS
ncbi:MAG: hypothetical protein GXC73_10960, partial [Chitinophagaceae bacterium]|nr:hypothetical protein [Chitinophagaceae bacterium]